MRRRARREAAERYSRAEVRNRIRLGSRVVACKLVVRSSGNLSGDSPREQSRGTGSSESSMLRNLRRFDRIDCFPVAGINSALIDRGIIVANRQVGSTHT